MLTCKNDRHSPIPRTNMNTLTVFQQFCPPTQSHSNIACIQRRMRLSMLLGGLIAKPKFSLPLLPSLLQLALGPCVREFLPRRGTAEGNALNVPACFEFIRQLFILEFLFAAVDCCA